MSRFPFCTFKNKIVDYEICYSNENNETDLIHPHFLIGLNIVKSLFITLFIAQNL